VARPALIAVCAVACVLAAAVAAGPASSLPRQSCQGRQATIVDSGTGKVRGTARADVILDLTGDARVDGGGGNDRICTGAGDDRVLGGSGSDRIETRGGSDEVEGGNGSDRVDAGAGEDVVIGERGNDVVEAGTGDRDFVNGSLGDDTLSGGAGSFDQVTGSVGNDRLDGGPGDGDVLRGDRGGDTLNGGPGAHDTASYAVSGDSGQVLGGRGVEVDLGRGVANSDGDDELSAVEDAIGTPFSDRLLGGPGPNFLYGANGGDQLIGNGAGDTAFGGAGGDRCGEFEGEDSCELHGVTGANPEAEALLLSGNFMPKPRLQVDLAGGPGATSLGVIVASNISLHEKPGVEIVVAFESGAWIVREAQLPIEAGDQCSLVATGEVRCPISGTPDALLLSGTAGADRLEVAESVPATVTALVEGEDGSDELIGGPGDDSLEGFGQPLGDLLFGRGGDDALANGRLDEGGPGSDLLIAWPCAAQRVVGGGGVDSVSFARALGFRGIEATLGGTAGLTAEPKRGEPAGCPPAATGPTVIEGSVESIEGSPGDDVLVGDASRNILLGRSGDDALRGEGGDDFLVGGIGRDELFGGAGLDRLYAVDHGRDPAIDCGPGGDAGVAKIDGSDPRPRSCRLLGSPG